MKPQLLKVSTAPTQSFSVRRDLVPYMNNNGITILKSNLSTLKEE